MELKVTNLANMRRDVSLRSSRRISLNLHRHLYLRKNSLYVLWLGKPAADILIVSRTPQARNCCTARTGLYSKASLESFGLMQRT